MLAYRLLVAIEKYFLDEEIHTSWSTIRRQLSTHQVVTVVLLTAKGPLLRIRKGTTPNGQQRDIYNVFRVPLKVMKPVTTWHAGAHL